MRGSFTLGSFTPQMEEALSTTTALKASRGEREMRFELTTSTLARSHSTAELFPRSQKQLTNEQLLPSDGALRTASLGAQEVLLAPRGVKNES